MKTALLVGGLPIAQQLHRLKTGVQVQYSEHSVLILICPTKFKSRCPLQMIIATPARLNDIIDNHPSDIELADVEALVMDEVDCLLQMGFEPQVHCTCTHVHVHMCINRLAVHSMWYVLYWFTILFASFLGGKGTWNPTHTHLFPHSLHSLMLTLAHWLVEPEPIIRISYNFTSLIQCGHES